MEIKVITAPINIREVTELAEKQFGNLVKATVDIKRHVIAIGGELHADEEQLLLEKGSKQNDLWGINLYPNLFGKSEFIEFDSLINLRPSQGNMSRGVEDSRTRKQIQEIVLELIKENGK